MGPSNRTIAGVAVLIFGAILLGVGIHHLIATGTCSSTGYSGNFGPVPTCPSGTGWWVGFLFGGIILGLLGAGLAASTGLVFVGIFGGIGLGALSLVFNSNVASGTQAFAGIFGAGFTIPAAIMAFIALNSGLESLSKSSSTGGVRSTGGVATLGSGRSRPKRTQVASNSFTPSSSSSSGSGGASAPSSSGGGMPGGLVDLDLGLGDIPGSGITSLPSSGSSGSGGDSLDQIAKLADLHKRGVLTDDEFAREKAKLLAE